MASGKVNLYAVSRELPKKELISETGNRVALSDFEGDFIIAIFWSRYCVPCLNELKSLSKFVEQTKNDGVRVIMISPKAEWVSGFSEQRLFMKKFEAENLEIYVDEKEAVASAFGVFSSPISILISRKGREIGRIRGSIRWDSSDVIDNIYKIKAERG
ncbi:MAG: TlpA family protein disulfide reductase [Alphaproteobacteria bacterium]|nr:TlpA family protein disulfide reductase [Alphaproteobacteria bacterium]